MRYYIIAGEASGDLHGANLIKQLRLRDEKAVIRAWGGDKMKAEGADIIKHYRDLAFMGFVEVLLNLRTILRNLRFCKTDILNFRPDVLILIDYPGFNLRIAEFASQQGLRVFYYISPTIWAWKEKRIHHIKKHVERMFVILPFEKAFYDKHHYSVDYCGHPLIDAIAAHKKEKDEKQDFRSRHQLDQRPIVLVLPGSRKQEIKAMLPIFTQVAAEMKEYQFLFAATSTIPERFYHAHSRIPQLKLIYNATYSLMEIAQAGIIKSGTSTLEAALFHVPQVVCYKGNALTIWLAKKIAKVRFISLPNLILQRELVRELIQEKVEPTLVKESLSKIIEQGNHRSTILAGYNELESVLGGPGASARVAEKMIHYLQYSTHEKAH